MSYFPISLPRAERQHRLLSDYGFSCRRVRVLVLIRPAPFLTQQAASR